MDRCCGIQSAIRLGAGLPVCSLVAQCSRHLKNVVRGVISVCGGIPGDWDSADRYQPSDTDALIIAGETDPFYPINRVRTFEPAIARRARAVTFKSYDIGHVFPRESLPFINQWILERTEADG